MGLLLADQRNDGNPLDQVMRLAENKSWSVERTTDDEVNMIVSNEWSDLYIALNWRHDLESLHVAACYDVKIPEARREETSKLLCLINIHLYHGHFDLWPQDGTVIYRNSLLLAGGVVASDAQCEGLMRLAAEYCQRYYPALQYVCWAGRSAQDTLDMIHFETVGQA